MARVGFTAATGDGYANHDILSWQYNSTYGPIRAVSPRLGIGLYAVGPQNYPGLSITGSVGSSYQIQYVSQLGGTNDWLTLANLVLLSNPMVWVDTTSSVPQTRFYRVIPY
jgi:hypothetical protein